MHFLFLFFAFISLSLAQSYSWATSDTAPALTEEELEKQKLINQYGDDSFKEKLRKDEEEKAKRKALDLALGESIAAKVKEAPLEAQAIFLKQLNVKAQNAHDPGLAQKIQQMIDEASTEEKDQLRTALAVAEAPPAQNQEMTAAPDPASAPTAMPVSTCDLGQAKEKFNEGKFSELVEQCLRPIRAMKAEDFEQQVLMSNEGKPMGRYFRDHPRALKFFVKLLQDKEAMVSASKMLENRQRFTVFLVINICLFLIAWIYKNFIRSQAPKPYFIRVKDGLTLFLVMFALRLSVLIYFFHQELGPLFKVIKDFYFA